MADTEKKLGIVVEGQRIQMVEISNEGPSIQLHKAVTVFAEDNDQASLTKAMQQVVEGFAARGKKVSIALTDRSIAFELITLPINLKKSDRNKIIERNAIRIGNSVREGSSDFQFAYRKSRDLEKDGTKQEEFIIQACAQELVDKYTALCEKSELIIQSLVALPEALSYSMQTILANENAVLVVDWGEATTKLTLLHQGTCLYTRILAKGLPKACLLNAKELNLGFQETEVTNAEKIQNLASDATAFGSTSQTTGNSQTESQPVDLRIPSVLSGELRRTIIYLERQFGLHINKVFMTGMLRAEPQMLEDLSASVDREVACADANLYPYMAAIGAVLTAEDAASLNLLPAYLRPQKGSNLKKVLIPTGALGLLLGFASLCFATMFSISEVSSNIDNIEKEIRRFKDEGLPGELEQLDDVQRRSEAALEIYQNRSPIVYFLLQFSYLLDKDVSLDTIRFFRYGEKWYTYCRGWASGIGALESFLDRLDKSPLIVRRKFQLLRGAVYLTSQPYEGAQPFELSIQLKGIN